MTFSLTTPVTGAPQTPFTSPTYTLSPDTPPGVNAKQWAVSALGGTQATVLPHAMSTPFTISQFRPQSPQTVKTKSNSGGVLSYEAPMNVYKTITRKSVIPVYSLQPKVMLIETIIRCPAGAESTDLANVLAALSLHIGSLNQQSAGMGELVKTGTL